MAANERAESAQGDNDLLNFFIECVHDYALFTLDAQGHVVTWGAGAERILGYLAEEIVGQSYSVLFEPEAIHGGVPDKELQSAATHGRVTQQGWRMRKNGSRFWAGAVLCPLNNDPRQGYAHVLRDLTTSGAAVSNSNAAAASSKTMLENARLLQKAGELSKELRRQNQALAVANEQKNEFLAMLAHELRNPLAPIANSLHIIRHEAHASPILQQATSMAERQVRQLTRLVDELLDVARITRGAIPLRKERVELSEVIARALETAQPLIDLQQHNLSVSYPRETVWLEADAIRLQQVLVNLLSNAAKYTPKGGQIWLTATVAGNEVVIKVRDNGVGIDGSFLPKIFDLFTQAKRSLARSEGGLGIGLTMVRELVEMHGGTVQASSAGLGQGSQFVICLPVLEVRKASPRRPIDVAEEIAECRRVLVVDDNVDAAETLAMILRTYGHEVVGVVYDGTTALDAIDRELPDVVLLDIGLPGIDGYQVAQEVRKDPSKSDVRLIAVTGYGLEPDRQRSQAAGFNYHMVKPVDPEELQELLAQPET